MNFSIFSKKIIAIILTLAFIVPGTFAIMPAKKAEASQSSCAAIFASILGSVIGTESALAPIVVPVGDNGKNVTGGATAGSSYSELFKNCIEEEVALAAGKYLLSKITNSMVQWINSGFNGQPTFMSNPDGFFDNIASTLGNQFLSNLSMCSPFQSQISIALSLNFSAATGYGGLSDNSSQLDGIFAQQNLCTVNNNGQDPFNNGSQTSGWAAFLDMTQNPANNPIGAYLQASAQLQTKISTAKNNQLLQLNWGHGFLSIQQCTHKDANGNTSTYASSGVANNAGDTCNVTTPGTVIAGQLNSQLGVAAQQLGLADDLDKIINALQGQLFNDIFDQSGGPGNSNGLLGAGGNVQKSEDGAYANKNNVRTVAQGSSNKIVQGANNAIGSATVSNVGGGGAAGAGQNLAVGQLAEESCPLGSQYTADKLNDGNKQNNDGYSFSGPVAQPGTACGQTGNAWEQITLANTTAIREIRLYQVVNPDITTFKDMPFHVDLEDAQGNVLATIKNLKQDFATDPIILKAGTDFPNGTNAKIVRVTADATGNLRLTEIEIYAAVAPTITLNGAASMIIQVGTPFSDPGATATDVIDGTLTVPAPKIYSIDGNTGAKNPVSSVDTSQAGTYSLVYTVTDSAKLTATQTRLVQVTATTGGN